MSETKVNPKSEDSGVTEFIWMKKYSNTFRSEPIQKTTEISECENSGRIPQSHDFEDEEEEEQEDLSENMKFTSDLRNIPLQDEEKHRWALLSDCTRKGTGWRYCQTAPGKVQDIPLDSSEIWSQLYDWKMLQKNMTFSVLYDSECDNDAGTVLEVNETKPNDLVQNIRKMICSSLVKTAAKANAGIITGGLNKGVDQLIGKEVIQRMEDQAIAPKFLLGIINRDCIAKKKNLLNDSHGSNGDRSDIIPTGLSSIQHHKHFLLVDDGTMKSDPECNLRQLVEDTLNSKERPLIYVLVGGRIDAIPSVKRALDKRRPVIIAMGTGGAADIITEHGAVMEYLPEIAEKLCNRLEELLIAGGIPDTEVRQVITNIKAESKLELLFEIVELLDKKKVSYGDSHQFKHEISTLKKTTTNELLAGIKGLLFSKQTSYHGSKQSAAAAESDTVNRMRAVFEQLLVVNKIPEEEAKRAVDHLESEVLNETVTKIKLVFTDLKAIRTHHQKYLLIKYDITSKEKKTIFGLIVEARMKGNGPISQPVRKCLECGVYHTDEEKKMSETKLKRKADDIHVTEIIQKIFKKRECNRFRKETNQHETEICECGYSKRAHIDEAKTFRNQFTQSEPSTKTFPTDAFGILNCAEDGNEYVDWKTKLKSIRYIRLDHKTHVNKISKLLTITWKMNDPDLIVSVLSDSDFDNDASKGNETIEKKSIESIQNIRKTICSSLVKAAASTNAWIITGGLDRGVDQLIGNEVKHRLANREKIPRAVLGICQWGCLAKKKCLLNEASSGSHCCKSGLSLNQHHTHFLLVDDGTQKKPGCECKLRQKIELTLTQRDTVDYDQYPKRPLIYVLIGGGVNALSLVECALADGIPVIIAMGTGGAADIISGAAATKRGFTLEHLPEIFERLFYRLDKLLTAGGTPENDVRQVIAKIKVKTKFEQFFKVVEFLGKARVSLTNDIANLKKNTTNELLEAIKDLLISRQIPSDDSYHSGANAACDTVNIMRGVFGQMLVINGIPPQSAKQAVDELENDVFDETLTKIRLVLNYDLDAIRKHDQLIICNTKSRQKETIIVEALKKVNWPIPSDVYMLAADWDEEKFFKQLLQENWMQHDHENVFRKLWDKRKTQYVKLMLEHIGNCNWLTTTGGSLVPKKDPSEQETSWKENNKHANVLTKLSDLENRTDIDDERLRIKAKMLFIWCVQNHMPETAMFFWEQGQDCLAMALLAYNISKQQKDHAANARYEDMKREQLASKTQKNPENKDKSKEIAQQQENSKKQEDHVNRAKYKELDHQQEFFAKLASDFVKKCHMDEPYYTYRLLSYKVEDLEHQTPLQIAAKAKFGAFFYADLLSEIWSENIINYSKNKYIPVILSIACPLLAPVLLEINTDSRDFKRYHHAEDNPINVNQRRNTSERYYETVRFYFSKVRRFVLAPVVKFYYSFIFYIAYLTLFSVVMLTDFRAKISPSEIVLIIWTFILFIEEVKQFIDDHDEYMTNEWNYFDIGALTLYIIGFILRMIYLGDPTICPPCLYVARIVLAFSLLIFFCRTLQYLSIYESLGPKIYMLYGLVSDLVGLLLILAVFISAYGVVSNVILYPNQPLTAQLIKDVIYDAWWTVLQQFNMDALGSNCNKNNVSAIYTAEYCSSTSDDNIDYVGCKENQCPANNWIVTVLLAFYALLTCIMLLNVLIAMFNSTFTTTDEKDREISNIQRFRVICEHRSHSMIPPPFCVITYPYLIIQKLLKLCERHSCCSTTDVEKGRNGEGSGSSKSSDEECERLRNLAMKNWELSMATEYHKEHHEKSDETRTFPHSTDATDSG